MTLQVINDAASVERQQKLLSYFETSAAEWMATAIDAGAARNDILYQTALNQASLAQRVADRIRTKLVTISGLTESDVMQCGPADASWLPPSVVAPPVEYQTYATPSVGTEAAVIRWLRYSLPDEWWSAPVETLATVARWLLALRQACWAGRWRP